MGAWKARIEFLKRALRGSGWFFAAGIGMSVLVSYLSLVNPRIIGFTVDSVLGDEAATLPAGLAALLAAVGGLSFLREHLVLMGLLVVAVALVTAVCRFFQEYLIAQGVEKLLKRLRDEVFGHLLRLPFSWHAANQTGDILQRCTSDVETLRVFLSEQMVTLIRVTLQIGLSMVFMLQIHGRLALATLAFIPVIVLYSLFFHRQIESSFLRADEEEGRLSAIVQENLTGVRVVRAFGREEYERQRFEKKNQAYTGLWVRLMGWLSAFWASGDLISELQVMVATAYGAALCVGRDITPGEYLAFLFYNSLLTWPVRELGRVISDMSKAGVAIDRISYILEAEEEKDAPGAKEPPLEGDIVFDHVSFAYGAEEEGAAEDGGPTKGEAPREVLRDVSFTVPAGSTVGILGGTGSGKSTLLHLLDKLYLLPEGCGSISIGGTDIRGIRTGYLRQRIGMVLQEPFLFSRTIEENIAITRDPGEDAQLQQRIGKSVRIASLEGTIRRFAKGYETQVGERGVTLSGGQKQRVAIAQMLVRRPPIMVFDDSLSAVDAETDSRIRQALRENLSDTTVILVAHRITTLMGADKIIVLDRGRVVEQGTHEELLRAGGRYHRIYALQSKQMEQGDHDGIQDSRGPGTQAVCGGEKDAAPDAALLSMTGPLREQGEVG